MMFIRGLLVHLVFLFSIFDIYFKSPIVRNVSPYQPHHDPLANRLVLFVVDGLRAESFVNYTTMAYLRSIANSLGRWGISNTQVPTESRPGHIAIIAGFYEDPSAITKGWKENPVDFDSVFNQTSYTWCWGTNDIVNIFTKGLTGHHIEVKDYDAYDQTFSTDKNTTHLDAWVFNNVKQFFRGAEHESVVKEKLQSNKILLFLHLLGTDSSGHTHKPKTLNFLTTLRHVDEGIKEIEKIIKDYYGNDGKTTFLMTSDHGMTDWGSHGAGDEHETQTPFVIWGSGVNQVFKENIQLDPETNGMSLEHRIDVNQVDLAPLMSTVLSIPVPVNSIGQLPIGLLNISLANEAKAIYSNSRQLASQYNKKRLDVEEHVISLLYQPYEPLSKEKYKKLIESTEKFLQEEKYEKSILISKEIIDLSLTGLRYYHNYYQHTLLILVSLSFLGWIFCLLRVLSEQKINTQAESSNIKIKGLKKRLLTSIFTVMGFTAFCLVYVQKLPIQYYLYFIMPIILWWYALSSLTLWVQTFTQIKQNKGPFLVLIFNYTVGCIAMSLSFTYRWMLSIPLLGMGLWPFFTSTRHHLTKPILVFWPIGCLLLSIFSFMPVVGKEVFIELVILAGAIWLLAMITFLYKLLLPLYKSEKENNRKLILIAIQTILLLVSLQNIYVQAKRFERGSPISYYLQAMAWITASMITFLLRPLYKTEKENKREIIMIVVQILLLLVSLQNIYVQSQRYERGTAVSYYYQAIAWTTALISLILPLTFSKRLICRLFAINTSIITLYLLLSVSHEGLFMVTLVFNITCWIYIEFRLLDLKNVQIIESTFEKEDCERAKGFTSLERGISRQDFRRAFFFILYIILAFFGTGNIASLNSFEVRWVTCFITSFKPYIITTLILLKTFAPFLTVACSFRAVQYLTKAPTGYLNIIVLIYSNLMGILLLYNVRNTGSWLEIGTSISQFVIVQVITLFIVIINQIAKFLTDISVTTFKSRKKYV